MGRNSKLGTGEDTVGGGAALPAAMVRELRHPEPAAADFTPTRFCPAGTKAWFAVHALRFVSSDFPWHQFTGRFYAQLMHCWGHIAHYDLHGFWAEFFTSTRNKVEFLEQMLAWPGYGQPDHTWCDVEQLVSRRVREAGLLPFYRQRLADKESASERAELARLLAKHRPGTPGAASVPAVPAQPHRPRPVPANSGPTRNGTAQLTLGLL